MAKVAIIGAGSITFTRRLVMDIMTVPELQNTSFSLMDISEEGMTVKLFEIPPEFVNYKAGQELLLRDDDVYDWSINRNGTLIGGFSRRLQREHIAQEERHQFDLYSGAIAFVPIEDISGKT